MELLRKTIRDIILENLTISDVNDLPFKKEIHDVGGEIYSIGGKVRDEFLGKESKDLDILITGVSMEDLEKILSKYGKVDLVGKSFGVIKFKPKGSVEDMDIAIPRVEKKHSAGHQGFHVTSDHTLPIEADLIRRDITINAIAKSIDGKIIDPFGGVQDLKNKIIRAVSEKSFVEDPLRMLRACVFAARFGFKIEPNTMQMIKDNASDIKEISAERILIEFDKIIKRGSPVIGIKLLIKSGLFKNIFGFSFSGDINNFSSVKTMADFIYLCFENESIKPSQFFKHKLKGDIDTTKHIEALELIEDISQDILMDRLIIAKMLNRSSLIRSSGILSDYMEKLIEDFDSGLYPKTLTELDVDGNDLLALGFKGKEVGTLLHKIFAAVLMDKLENNKEKIIEFINQEQENLMENVNTNTIKNLFIFDFDQTLVSTATPEKGKPVWKKKTGQEWSYKGWWGRPESLAMDIFDMPILEQALEGYEKASNLPNSYKVMMTGRIPQLEALVKNILKSHNLHFNEYLFNNTSNTLSFKLQQIERFIEKFAHLENLEIWEDRIEHAEQFEKTLNLLSNNQENFTFIVHHCR